MSKKKNIKLDLSVDDVYEYIREGMRREGLVPPDGNEHFMLNMEAVNADDVLVEVTNVSVAAKERDKGTSLADLRAKRTGASEETEEAERPARKPTRRDDGEERTLIRDEDDDEIEKELKKFSRRMPPAPPKGDPPGEKRKVRIGLSLDDLGKDPTDMRGEI